MAQTADGFAQEARDMLTTSFNADSKADKNKMVSDILVQLTPSDSASILQLASLNPDELVDSTVISAISKNVNNVIQAALQDQLNVLQSAVDAQQQALADQQAALDAQKANLNDLGQVISNIGK